MILGVPTLNRYDLLEKLIASALRGTRRPDRILVVDNGGQYSSTHPDVHILYSGTNLGVAASWNLLLAAGAWIISNDDVELGERTFAELAAALEEGNLFVEGDGWALFGQRPEVMNRVGPYDDNFFPAYYEDNDYSWRLEQAAIERCRPLSSPVFHAGWSSSKLPDGSLRSPTEHVAWLNRNRGIYIRKWGGLPGEELFMQPYDGEDIPDRVRPGLAMRWEILNQIAADIGARRYLEIGTGEGECVSRMVGLEKFGVDPSPTLEAVRACHAFFPLTSAEFFRSTWASGNRVDLVFIDGDHRAELVYAEVEASLQLLTDGGAIVVHCTSPYTEAQQAAEPSGLWTGDVWKAVVRLRAEGVHDVRTLHTDFGLTVIRPYQGRGPQPLPRPEALTWSSLAQNRRNFLGLMDPDELDDWLRGYVRPVVPTSTRLLADVVGGECDSIELRPTLETPWMSLNPSVVATEDSITTVVPAVMFDARGVRRTRNLILRHDAEGMLVSQQDLGEPDNPRRYETGVRGITKLRIFRWQDHLHIVGSARDMHSSGDSRMVMGRVAPDGIVDLTLLEPDVALRRHQEDWTPFVSDDRLLFVCAFEPFIVLEWKPGQQVLVEVKRSSIGFAGLTGGSPGLNIGDDILLIAREASCHRFVLLDAELDLKAVSEPFSFEGLHGESCAGLTRFGDDLLISYGVDGEHARMMAVDAASVLESIVPVN